MEPYNYLVTVSRFDFYDIQVVKLSLLYDEEGHAMDTAICSSTAWGAPSPMSIKSPKTFPLPTHIDLRWITLMEGKCFELSETLDQTKAEELWKAQSEAFPDDPFKQYVIGIAPYGGVAIWLCNNKKSILLHWLQAEETAFTEKEAQIHTPDPEMEFFTKALLPPDKLQNDMRQYCHRLIPLEEFFEDETWRRFDTTNIHYEAIDLDCVEVKRLDGTYDFTGNDALLRYQETGKPHRVTVKWHEDDSSYLAHFWLDETEVTFFFNSMFDNFPEIKADLLFRIDTRANRYEIAMTGEGLPTRRLKHTQYIVFKDFVEVCRSLYFSKKDGEWNWE